MTPIVFKRPKKKPIRSESYISRGEYHINIFVLDQNPKLAAQYHCDKHVVKMVLETVQILSTVVKQIPGGDNLPIYRITHQNHPVVKWAGRSWDNLIWTLWLGRFLLEEYTLRYKKQHACKRIYDIIVAFLISASKKTSFKEAPILEYLIVNHEAFFEKVKDTMVFEACMPPHCIDLSSVVQSYRNYYMIEKSSFAKWKFTETPEWYRKLSTEERSAFYTGVHRHGL